MAKKSSSDQSSFVDAALVISKEKFQNLLEAQIQKGNELLLIEVPKLIQGTRAYGAIISSVGTRIEYDESSKKEFVAQFNRWHDMNIEIYKSSFEVPNNTYRQAYENQVWATWGTDVIKEYKDDIERLINKMKSDIEKLPLIKCKNEAIISSELNTHTTSKDKVFIVHGHDGELKEKTARILTQLNLNPIILHEQADCGRTIIEKFEANAEDCGFAIILLTADDLGQSKREKEQGDQPKNRARQNVVFEMGYFMGRLTRKHVFVLLDEGVEKPGDLDGLVYVSSSDDYWVVRLGKELKNCGYNVDMNKLII